MDIQYLLFLQNIREATGGVLDSFFLQISDLSYGIFIWKLTFCVYRPWIRCDQIVPVETASGYSFPSGHSITATSNYGTMMERNRKHKPLCIFLGFMILLTIFSRNYIGVHTPQDVIVGTLLGAVVVVGGAKVWEWIDEHPEKDWVIHCAGVVLTILFLIYISVKSYPMNYVDEKLLVDPEKMKVDGFKDAGRLLGVTLGWFLERHFVRFSMDVPALQKVTRAGVGVLLLIFIEKCLTPAVTGAFSSSWVNCLMTFLELFLLMVVYPLCFSRLEGSGTEKILS